MLKYFLIFWAFAVVFWAALAGPRGSTFVKPPYEVFPDMDRQEKLKPQSASAFFSDGMGSRPTIDGAVPMGLSIPDRPAQQADGGVLSGSIDRVEFSYGNGYFYTGIIGEYYGDGLPDELAIDADFLLRGKERYAIHCAICHGIAGDGEGVVKPYGAGFVSMANFLESAFHREDSETYRPDGSIFQTITNGRGLMGPYGANINVRDRWAIVAYIRALQMGVHSGSDEGGAESSDSSPSDEGEGQRDDS
jgi:mono/diheme cytochrome c family protein